MDSSSPIPTHPRIQKSRPMRVACVNYYYDRSLRSPEDLLRAYPTLTGWAEGLASAGAEVTVIQRFVYDAAREQNGIQYQFVCDQARRMGGLLDRAARVNQAVTSGCPDVVHVNGLCFARQAGPLKRSMPETSVLVQDHAGPIPDSALHRRVLRASLLSMNAVSFVSREQASPWIAAGILDDQIPIFELMEGSSRFQLLPQDQARSRTGLIGAPCCLWVGRLNENKDPLTVLRGFAEAVPTLPDPRLAMVYTDAPLLLQVRAWLRHHPETAARVLLLGYRKPEDLEWIYNSADLFLLGSHHEGSGYAVLEALSCGVAPVITDIPSFRILAGGARGNLWPPEDSHALAGRLMAWSPHCRLQTRSLWRAVFDERFSFVAIGRDAVACYRSLMHDPGRCSLNRQT